MTRPLPEGWAVVLDPATRRTDGGRTLIGGTPLRVLRLSEAGARWLDGECIPRTKGEHALARRLVDSGAAHPVPADEAPDLSCTVVVPVKDDPEGVAVVRRSVGEGLDLLVVDDGSSPALPDADLRNPQPLGPGGARDQGWREVDADVVAFLDAGVELPDGWLAPLLAHFRDESVGAVAPRTAPRPGGAPGWLARYEDVRSPLDLGPAPAPVRPGTRAPYVPTTALLVRRSALEQIDGFDTTLRYGEDVDLVWRLGAAGWVIRYEPSVVVTHPCRPDFAGWLHQRVQYGRSAAPLAERHGTAGAPLQLSGWSALAWGAVLVGHPLLGAGVAAGTTAALVPKLGGLDDPVGESLRLAGLGHLWAGRAVAEALRRPWWPLALALAAGHRRARPAVAAAMVVPPLLEWRERRPALDPLRWTALRLADDFAYGLGVWQGALKARSLRSLLPRFTGPLRRPGPA